MTNEVRYTLKHLRDIREAKHLSQGKLAELSKVAKSTIIHLERGKNQANGITVAKLAGALGVTREELTGG